jgi:hypothetical protein
MGSRIPRRRQGLFPFRRQPKISRGQATGSRRYHAAKQLELKKVPCLIKEATAEEARQLAMISSQSEKWPHIVLDKCGAVVGGNCLAVKFSIDPEEDDKDRPKVKRYMVAEWLGLTSDVKRAHRHHRLFFIQDRTSGS